MDSLGSLIQTSSTRLNLSEASLSGCLLRSVGIRVTSHKGFHSYFRTPDLLALKLIAKFAGCDLELLISDEDIGGVLLPNGSFNGMVGMLSRGEADIGMSFTVTRDRWQVVRYGHPSVVGSVATILSANRPRGMAFAVFLSLACPTVWTLLILFQGIFITLSCTLGKIKSKAIRRYRRLLIDILVLMYFKGSMQQPIEHGAKIDGLLSFWLIMIQLVRYHLFTQLESILSKPRQVVIHSLRDLIDPQLESVRIWTIEYFTVYDRILKVGTEISRFQINLKI